jgi:hypothetical protein
VDTAPDTSRDEEIARKLFSDLNCSHLRPPDNGNVIVISNFEEEEEVREDDHADAGAMPFSPRNSLAPSACVADDNEVQGDSSDGEDGAGTS